MIFLAALLSIRGKSHFSHFSCYFFVSVVTFFHLCRARTTTPSPPAVDETVVTSPLRAEGGAAKPATHPSSARTSGLPDVEITGSAMSDKPVDSRITKTTALGATTSKSSTGKASGFQSYKDVDLIALFGELHRRVGESRQAEDSVLAELQEKFEVCTYISPSPQVPGY